jgi:hypothetical protein
MYRSEISLWMDGEVGVIALVGEEWGNACGCIRSVVACELCEGQEFRPVVLLIVGVYLKILLKCLVHLLGLFIPFQVITRGEVEMDVKGFTQRMEEVGDELWSPVRGDVMWEGTPCLENTLRRNSFGSSGEVMVL